MSPTAPATLHLPKRSSIAGPIPHRPTIPVNKSPIDKPADKDVRTVLGPRTANASPRQPPRATHQAPKRRRVSRVEEDKENSDPSSNAPASYQVRHRDQ